jgi:hypothetical protein
MSDLEKAMVLLDMARDHLQNACQGRDDIEDMIDDIGKILVVLEGYSKWPNWEAEEAMAKAIKNSE